MLAAILAGALLVALTVAPAAGAAGWLITSSTKTMNENVQDISESTSLPVRSRILDRQGNLLAWVYNQNRQPVKFNQIADSMKQSIIAIEDRRFYEHRGVDVRGTVRAAVANFTKGGVAEGASTIDQQYVKNYLWLIDAESNEEQQAAIETSIPRKLREMKMAAELDRKLGKDEILTRYLNLISFGNGAYGIQAAAQTYFGVNASKLTDTQSALLAGVVQSTSALNPFTNPDGALARRNMVLQARVAAGSLSPARAEELQAEPLGVLDRPRIPSNGCITAGSSGFFCDYALEFLERAGLSRDKLASGGYTVRTTLDPAAQNAAVAAATNHVNPQAPGVAAATGYVNPTATRHEVVALASSRTYGLNTQAQETVLPLTHSLQGHGAGSVFKVFAAAVALQEGMGIDSVLKVPSRIEVSGMGDGGAKDCPPTKYCVENAGAFRSTMTLRDALATSPNTPFVAIAEKVGVAKIMDMAYRLGLRSYKLPGSLDGKSSIYDFFSKANLGSFVLGPTAVNPVELSNVAATLADGGRWCEPTPILEVRNERNQPVPLKVAKCEQAIEQPIAAALAAGMGSDVATGTARGSAAANNWNGPLAAKTGTTETSFSAAFLAFTGRWAGSSYIFNDGGTASSLCTSPVRQCEEGNLYGGTEPAGIFFATTNQVVDAYGGRALPPFDPIFLRGRNPDHFADITVPSPTRGSSWRSSSRSSGDNDSSSDDFLSNLRIPQDWQDGLDNLLQQLRGF